VRAARIAFSAPYITIEGVYLVPAGSALQRTEDVDRPGTRIGVIVDSAYDLFLTRGLKHAELVRLAGPEEVRRELVEGRVDLIAGVKPALEADARVVKGSRLLPEAFMSIRQAMGTPREREAGAAHIALFIEDAKRSDLLAELFARNRVEGGSLA
jgi:polar amino acid transport system substrate-binding protein